MPTEDWYNQMSPTKSEGRGAPMVSTGAPSPLPPDSLLQGEEVPNYPQMDELGSPKGQAYMQYMSARAQEIQAQSESHIKWMDQLSQMVVEHGDNEYIMQTLNNALQLEGMRGQALSKASEEFGSHITKMHEEDQKFYGPLHDAMEIISSGYDQGEDGSPMVVDGADEVLKGYQNLPQQQGLERRKTATQIYDKARVLAQQTLLQRARAKEDRENSQALSLTRAKSSAKAAIDAEALQTSAGPARDKQAAKDYRKFSVSSNQFRNAVEGMKDLREEYGTEFIDRVAVAKGKQLAAEARIAWKNMAGLGVLSASDIAMMDKVIPEDPLDVSFNDAQMAKFDQMLERLDNAVEVHQAEYLRGGVTSGNRGVSKSAPQAPPAGMVEMTSPDGKRGFIPQDKVDAAKSKGFKVAQ